MEQHYQALSAIAEFPNMDKCREFLESRGITMRWDCEPPYRIMARTAEVALYPQQPAKDND